MGADAARAVGGAGAPAPAAEAASYEAHKREKRELERKQRRLVELEREVAAAEQKLAGMRERLKEPPGEDWLALAKLAEAEQTLQRRLDGMLEEWATLGEELGGAAR
ncbi:MAG: hypothetical protein HY908_24260 [Myxococcales bacterium]|nr:hypothetical protein [Myxococcales bacterium]